MVCCDNLSTATAQHGGKVDLTLLKGVDSRQFVCTLTDTDGAEINLTNATLSGRIYDKTAGQLVTTLNTAIYQPPTSGAFYFWLSETQSALLTKAIDANAIQDQCDPTCYAPYRYEIDLTSPLFRGSLTDIAAGQFTTIEQHLLAAGDTVLFTNTAIPSINENTYVVDSVEDVYKFTINSLSGLINASPGGEASQMVKEFVLTGDVLAINFGS